MGRSITKPAELSGESEDLYKAINAEAPLACALIVGASLEKALISILGKFFVECETAKNVLSEKGALRDFAHCADVAYCLGLISQGMLENLKIFGRIRNAFAHSHPFIDFDDKTIQELCAKLTLPHVAHAVVVGGGEPTPLEKFARTPRERFSLVGVLSFQRLLGTAISTEHRNKSFDYWDEEKE